MVMKVTDSIHGASRGDAELAIQRAAAAGAVGPYAGFIREVFRVAPLMPTPIDPACVVAQSAQETGYWTENEWINDLNPGAIGITEEGMPSPFNPPYVQTGERSARLMLLEVWAHMHPTPPYPSVVQDMVAIDGWLDEVQTVQQDPNRPPVETLQDLHIPYVSSGGVPNCTWACDPGYSTGIVTRGNYLFPNLPDQTVAFEEGDTVETTAADVNLRDAPNLSGAVLAVLPQGRNGIILQGPTVADGFSWYRVDTRNGRGWVAGTYLAAASFNNLIKNPTANSDLAYIFPNRSDSSHISRLTVDGNSRVKVVNDGLNAGEGVRYESLSDLNWTGQKYFGGVIHHLKRVPGSSGTLDYIRVGVFYTDGSVDYSSAVPLTLTDSWNTIVAKSVASNPAKTIRKVAFVVAKNAPASAFSFYADNARVVQL